jgi:phosphoglycolate phosphatase
VGTDRAGRRLVLWDIDHTLLDAGGVGGSAHAAVFERLIGRPMERLAAVAGRTEQLIFAETLLLHGIHPTDELLGAFLDQVGAEMTRRAPEMRTRGRVLPGAAAALRAVGSVPGVRQSVLTGNTRAVAELKMSVFGLAEHVDFAAGGYGDDALDRSDLLFHAWRRARQRYGRAFSGTDTVLVGDTVLDVAAAKAGGAAVIAVATGRTGAAELRAAGADLVLADLGDPAPILDLVAPRG